MEWNKCELSFRDDLSELVQHEYDHLDGILATMRAIDNKSFIIKTMG
jgi:peptide deformylase